MTKLEEAFEEELEKRHSTLIWQLGNANKRIENLEQRNEDLRNENMNQLARQLADLLDAPWRQLPEGLFDKEIHVYTREKSTTPPEYPEREIQVIRSQKEVAIKVSLLILPTFVRKGDFLSEQINTKTKWIRGHNLTLQNEDALIPILLEKMLTEDFNWNEHFFKGEIVPEVFKE